MATEIAVETSTETGGVPGTGDGGLQFGGGKGGGEYTWCP